jgi:hypothetical protein
MGETRVRGAGEDVLGETQLGDSSKTLKDRGVDDRLQKCAESIVGAKAHDLVNGICNDDASTQWHLDLNLRSEPPGREGPSSILKHRATAAHAYRALVRRS